MAELDTDRDAKHQTLAEVRDFNLFWKFEIERRYISQCIFMSQHKLWSTAVVDAVPSTQVNQEILHRQNKHPPKFEVTFPWEFDVQLRIVNKFRSISEAALNEQPENIDDLAAVLEEQAVDLWEHVTAMRDCAKEILLLLGPADEEVEDLGWHQPGLVMAGGIRITWTTVISV